MCGGGEGSESVAHQLCTWAAGRLSPEPASPGRLPSRRTGRDLSPILSHRGNEDGRLGEQLAPVGPGQAQQPQTRLRALLAWLLPPDLGERPDPQARLQHQGQRQHPQLPGASWRRSPQRKGGHPWVTRPRLPRSPAGLLGSCSSHAEHVTGRVPCSLLKNQEMKMSKLLTLDVYPRLFPRVLSFYKSSCP